MSRESTKVKRVCQICGVTFLAKPAEVRRGAVLYCSRTCMGLGMRLPWQERFHKYSSPPNEHGCILWTGPKSTSGYGILNCQKELGILFVGAHRLAWKLEHGEFPDELDVLHDCDQFYDVKDITYRSCVNPAHLFLGTHQDNMADKVAKDRQVKGEECGLSKLTEAKVRSIRRLYATGRYTMKQIGDVHKTVFTNVWHIVRGKTWKHIL